MHIVDDNKKIDTFRLTQVFAVFNLILDSYWSIHIENLYKSNYMTLTEKQLDPNLSKFEIETTGEGCAMVHLVEKYNVMPEVAQPETGLRVNVFVRAKSRQCTIREQRKITVCANYKSRRHQAYRIYRLRRVVCIVIKTVFRYD